MESMSLQKWTDNLSANNEVSFALTHKGIEQNVRSAKEEEDNFRLCSRDKSKEIPIQIKNVSAESQQLNEHFGSRGWELIQWFHFCGVTNAEKAELKNEFKIRKPKGNCNCQCILDLENNLCCNENITFGDFDDNTATASVLSVQGQLPFAEQKHTLNVNVNVKRIVNPHYTRLSTTEEITTILNNAQIQCGEVSQFSNKVLPQVELLGLNVGCRKTQKEDHLEDVIVPSKMICEFPKTEYTFKDITRFIFHEDMKKNISNGDNLECFKAFQNPAIGVTSPANALSSFKNKTNLEISQNNLFCKENRIVMCSASSGLTYAITQEHFQKVTEQTNFESMSYHMKSAKSEHSQQHYVEKRNVLNPNIVKSASVVTECCESNYTSVVGKQDYFSIRAQNEKTSNTCNESLLAYSHKSTPKNAKRKLQDIGEDDGEQKAKRFLNFHTYANTTNIESNDSSNASHNFEAVSEKEIGVLATKQNDCASAQEYNINYAPMRMRSAGSHKGSLNMYDDLYCHKKTIFLNEMDFLLTTVELLQFKNHLPAWFCNSNQYFTGTGDCDNILLMEPALVTDLFLNNVSGDYARSFEHACKYLPRYEESDSNKYLIRRFRCLKLEHCSIPNQIMSENSDEDICYKNNCLQADTSVHQRLHLIKSNLTLSCNEHSLPQCKSTLLKREQEVKTCGKNELLLRPCIASSLNENCRLQKWNISDQDHWKHSEIHKSIPESSVTFIFADKIQFIFNKTNMTTKTVSVMHSEALSFTLCKELPKKDNKPKYDMFTKEGLFGTCNNYSALRDAICLANIYLFADTLTSSEDSSNLPCLLFKEKCLNNTWKIDVAKRYIASVNYVKFSSQINFEKGLDCNSSNLLKMKAIPKYIEQKKQNRSKPYPSSTFAKENMSYCVLGQNDIEQTCFKSSMDSIEEVAYLTPTFTEVFNTATEEYNDFRKLERNSFCRQQSISSILDSYQKIPLSSNFEDLDKVNLESQVNYEEYVEVSSASCSIPNTHKCTYMKNTTGISKTFPSTQMETCKLGLLNLEEKDNSEHANGIGGNGQLFERVELYAQLPLHGPDEETIQQSLSSVYCNTLLFGTSSCEDKSTALTNQISVVKSEHFMESLIEEIKQSSPTRTDLRVSDNTTFTYEQVQVEKQTDVKKQCTSEKDEHKVLHRETMLTDKMLNEICTDSKHKCAPDSSIVNAESAITFMKFPSDGQEKTEFAMKPQFDLVLEELSMFHEISREQEEESYNEEIKSAHNLSQTIINPGCEPKSKKKDDICISENKVLSCVGYDTLRKHNGSRKNPGLCKRKVPARKQEQEVPNECLYSSATEDESLYLATDEDHLPLKYKKGPMWSPSFSSWCATPEGSTSVQYEHGSCFSTGIVRVQPLKTCTGPIRIGLSRKTKIKQLHPYLKY